MPSWQVPPGSFHHQLFRILVQNVSFRNRLNQKLSAGGGTCQDGVKIAYRWCISGHAHWRNGDKFSRESDFWLISILCSKSVFFIIQHRLWCSLYSGGLVLKAEKLHHHTVQVPLQLPTTSLHSIYSTPLHVAIDIIVVVYLGLKRTATVVYMECTLANNLFLCFNAESFIEQNNNLYQLMNVVLPSLICFNVKCRWIAFFKSFTLAPCKTTTAKKWNTCM